MTMINTLLEILQIIHLLVKSGNENIDMYTNDIDITIRFRYI